MALVEAVCPKCGARLMPLDRPSHEIIGEHRCEGCGLGGIIEKREGGWILIQAQRVTFR